MRENFLRSEVRACLLLALATLCMPAWVAAQSNLPEPFLRDATAGINARTFYMDVNDRSKPPAVSEREAWAIGGKLWGLTGWWNDRLQLGASYYLSAPLYAPEDKDGTELLEPGQKAISVIGEAFVRLKFDNARFTGGRQEIDMSYPRAAHVRLNRSDATYVGKQDSRMVPITYEAVLLNGQVENTLNYYLGWVSRVKPRNLSEFQSVGATIGAKGSEADMWYGGVQVTPTKDFWLQGWYYLSPDVLRIGWLDGDYVLRLPQNTYLRFAAQYTDQRSDGANQLIGRSFSTSNAQGYAEYGVDIWTIYGAYSRTGSGSDIRIPFTSGPIYTRQIVRTFVRAHETAWQLGVAVELQAVLAGLSGFLDWTRGTGAINAATGAGLADATEYDVGVVWTYKSKGSSLDGLRTRIRCGWVIDNTSLGGQRTTDFRIDANLPINLL